MGERVWGGMAALFCCAVLFGAAKAAAAEDDKKADTQTATFKISGMT